MQRGHRSGDGSCDEADGWRRLRRHGAGILWGIVCCGCLGAGAHGQELGATPVGQQALSREVTGQKSGQTAGEAERLQAEQLQAGTISGTVTDADGALVPGARVTLSRSGEARRTVVTDGAGEFRFANVAPGKFRLTVMAKGMAVGEAAGTLLAGQAVEVAPIVLDVATASQSVEVTIPTQEVAEEQMKHEEQQRVLGVIPNYFVTYSRNPAPLDPKQKFNLAGHVIFDPTSFLFAGVAAGIEQGENTFPGYGPGWPGFGKRYGAALANATTSTLLRGAVFPALLRQDPRYYYRGTGSVRSRAVYALETAVICKGDNGRWQPNYSSFLGALGSGAISNLYYPASSRDGAGLTLGNAALSIVGVGVGHLAQEFLFRRFTHHAAGAP